METKKSAGELTIQLLWNQANILPQQYHTTRLLRSFYLTTCKKIAKRDVQLPALRFTPSVMCPKCSSIWSESKFSLALKSLQIHSHKAEKLVGKLDNDHKSLSKKQKKRAKWLKKRICRNVEITCGFCQKKTRQALINEKVKTKTDVKEPEIELPAKKKKKKKKDKSAGLKLDKIISNVKKPNAKVTAKKTAKPKQQPSNAKKEKTISKTQKQNSILQLAKMLKNQSSVPTTKTNNSLEKLLR